MDSRTSRSREAFQEGMEHHLRKRPQKAIRAFRQAIEHDQTFVPAHFWLGSAHFAAHNWKEAIVAFSNAIAFDPAYTTAYDMRATCYQEIGDLERYREDCDTAARLGGVERSPVPDEYYSSIYTTQFLLEARRLGFKIAKVTEMMPEERVRRYPDGSLQLDGGDLRDRFDNWIMSSVRKADQARALEAFNAGDKRILTQTVFAGFNSLSHFPVRTFLVVHWCDSEMARVYDAEGLHVVTCLITNPAEGDVTGPIDNLPVTVVFHRRLSKRLRSEFAALIARYLDSVRLRGMFAEGPVRPVSSEIGFYSRVAQFRIDASHSGQETINWLILSILAFSSLNPVLEIYFTEHPRHQPPVSSFEEVLCIREEDRTSVPIPIEPTSA